MRTTPCPSLPRPPDITRAACPEAKEENYLSDYLWKLHNALSKLFFNIYIDLVDWRACSSFGRTTQYGDWISTGGNGNAIVGIKHLSCKEGTLQSISLYAKYYSENSKIKCAIYDTALNLLTNGTTEEKTVTSGQAGLMTFNFSTAPEVENNTYYYLTVWPEKWVEFDGQIEPTVYAIDGYPEVWDFTYDSWVDPWCYNVRKAAPYAIYATYV